MARDVVDASTLGTALAHAPAHVIVTDADLKIRYLNHEADDAGPSLGDGYLDALPPERSQQVLAVVVRARESDQPQEYETAVDSPSGCRWFSTRVSWFRAPDGSAGMISVRTEVTPHRLEAQHLRRDLMQASHRAGMAEIATGVLHNVSNVLNSVNVATETLLKRLEGSRLHLLGRAVLMLTEHTHDLARFITQDPKGTKLPQLLAQLDQVLVAEHEALRQEAVRLAEHIGLMRSIVEAQQTIAKIGDEVEPTRPKDLVEQTLSMFQLDLETRRIELVTTLPDLGEVVLDRQAVLQVLSNLVRNAIEALEAVERPRRLSIEVRSEGDRILFVVEDDGAGVDPTHLDRLFDHGFSTKRNGHGFGLHASAIAARSMNGTLVAHSAGLDEGARFCLSLPRQVR